MSVLPEFPQEPGLSIKYVFKFLLQFAALAGTAVPMAIAAAPAAAITHFKVFFILLFLLKNFF